MQIDGRLIAIVVVLLLLFLWWHGSLGTASAAAPAPAASPAADSSALQQFFAANSWEKRLPSGARTVFQFVFQGANVLMSRAGYTAEGSAAGSPTGATVAWSQTGPDTVQLSQGGTKLDLTRASPSTVTLGPSGGAGTTLTAAK